MDLAAPAGHRASLGPAVIVALRALIALMALGTVAMQVALPVFAWHWSALPPVGDLAPVVLAVAAVEALGLCFEAVLFAAWKLLTMVRRGRIFTERALRWDSLVIGATAAACAVTLALLVAGWFAPAGPSSADNPMPAATLFVAWAALFGGFVAELAFTLVMVVMRKLLRLAVEQSRELAQVI